MYLWETGHEWPPDSGWASLNLYFGRSVLEFTYEPLSNLPSRPAGQSQVASQQLTSLPFAAFSYPAAPFQVLFLLRHQLRDSRKEHLPGVEGEREL